MAVAFIGLGGTGNKVIARAKEILEHKLKGAYGGQIGFLGIDIGGKERPSNLLDPEFINLERPGTISSYLEKGYKSQILDWWPAEYSPNYQFDGTAQERLIGTFALFLGYDLVASKLQNLINKLGGDNIDFILVASTSGGTGSSLFRPIVSIISEKMGGAFYIRGVLLLHDVINNFWLTGEGLVTKEYAFHNSLAFLTELDRMLTYEPIKKFVFKAQGGSLNLLGGRSEFKNIYLISATNGGAPGRVNQQFDEKEDYIEFAASFLENLLYIHFEKAHPGEEFSGIENTISIGSNTIFLKLDGGNYLDLVSFGNLYCSFGEAIIEFPAVKVKDYVASKIIKQSIDELLEKRQDKTSIVEDLKTKIVPFKETDNADSLVKLAKSIFRNIAMEKEGKTSPFTHPENMQRKMIKERLLRTSNYEGTVADFKNKIESIAREIGERFKEEVEKYLKEFISSLDRKISDESLTLSDRLAYLNEARFLIENEKKDFENNEVRWLRSVNLANYENLINDAISKIKGLEGSSAFKKWFTNWKKDREFLIGHITEVLIHYIEKYHIFTNFVNEARSFYEKLLYEINERTKSLEKLREELLELSHELDKYAPPSSIQQVTASKGKVDFKLLVAYNKTIIDDNIKTESLFNDRFPKDLKNIAETLKVEADEKAAAYLTDLTLEELLRWEARFFLKKMYIKGLKIEITGFENAIKRSGEEWLKISEELSNFYDPDILHQLKNNPPSDEEEFIDKLIEARLKLFIDLWNAPMVVLNEGRTPYLSVSENLRKHTVLVINSSNGTNKKVIDILSKHLGMEVSSRVNSNDKTYLAFLHVIAGFPLPVVLANNNLYKQEKNRRELIRKLYAGDITFHSKVFSDLKAIKFAHQDTRFLGDPYLFHSIFLPETPTVDFVALIMKLLIYLLALDKVEIDKEGKIKLKESLSLNGRTLISKDAVEEIGSIAEFFRLMLYVFNDEVVELLKELEKENPDPNKIKESIERIDRYELSYFDSKGSKVTKKIRDIIPGFILDKTKSLVREK